MQASDAAALVNKLTDDDHQHHQHEKCPTRNISVFSLPWDIIAKGMHVTDLLRLEQTCKYFRALVRDSKALWQHASYYNYWPQFTCLQDFQRGANAGNIEALTKMAMAYLYHEGLSPVVSDEDRKVQICGEKAAEIFATLERLAPSSVPFTWIFFRPPWSTVLSAKRVVFEEVQKKVSTVDKGNMKLAASYAAALDLLGLEQAQAEARDVMEKAAEAGCSHASFSLLLKKHLETKKSGDPAKELEQVRKLRAIVEQGCPEARLLLANWYAAGCTGGRDQQHVQAFMRSLFHCPHGDSGQATRAKGELTPAIRYILIDWLVEVATIKYLDSQLVHMAVTLMDRFLRRRMVQRSCLQLLGISTMVLSSRFIGQEIITIREASWLTDSTYNYEEVVHMITEVVATVEGVITVPTILDYLEILWNVLDMTKEDCTLAKYISEMCLLQAEVTKFCAKKIAAGCIMLTKLIRRVDSPWPTVAENYTGFSKHHVASVASAIYKKCYKETPLVDHRNVALVSVKNRFAGRKYYRVTEIVIDEEHDDWILCQLTEFIHEATCKEETELVDKQGIKIFSPCRNPGKAALRRKWREKECSTPDNSSDNTDDVSDSELSYVRELPPDGEEEPEEELPNVVGWVPLNNAPVSPAPKYLKWPPVPAGDMSEASSSANSDNDDDLAVRLPPSFTVGNGPSSSSGNQENVRGLVQHSSAGEYAALHTQGGGDSGPLARVSVVDMPERSSTLPAFIQQMHLLQHQATCDDSCQLSSAEESLAQPGFSGTELSTATKSAWNDKPVCDAEDQNAQEACGQQFMESGSQQVLQQSDPLKGGRGDDGGEDSLLPQELPSAEGKEQGSGKGGKRKRSSSPGEGTSGLGQSKSEMNECKVMRV